MITGIQHLHSTLRWVVLILLVLTLIRAWTNRSGSFTVQQAKLGLFTMISLHVQLLFGLVLYVQEGWMANLGDPSIMGVTRLRFFTVEHLAGMLIAIVFGTLGHSLVKRASDDAVKYRRQLIYFGIALILILASIPWPMRPGLETSGWF